MSDYWVNPSDRSAYDRVLDNVLMGANGCWLYAHVARSGYGRIVLDGKWRVASRVMYAAAHGEIPRGLLVCHHCDVRRCVRPDHLFLGTHKDNMQDAVRKGRLPGNKRTVTHCKHGHALTPDNVYVRRASGKRTCRTCDLANQHSRRGVAA